MINRQILVVRGKKRRKGGGRERSEKDTFAFLLLERRAHPIFFFLNHLLPTTLPCQNIKCNLYSIIDPLINWSSFSSASSLSQRVFSVRSHL
ncbi:hypothetical protein [Aneurinibacillus migulanus]|uniref:hypothetical protein n=1 Tax=Aneurinibacillus migulanus TaxID=47500 RepID=UPI001F269BDB|nr:hypothetical protein [Aneurinibacillus migulanus]